MPQRPTTNRLLIIDDDIQLLDWIEKVAHSLDYVVDKAPDIDAAIDLLEEHPDLIVVDHAQGFLLGRPQPFTEFRSALRRSFELPQRFLFGGADAQTASA